MHWDIVPIARDRGHRSAGHRLLDRRRLPCGTPCGVGVRRPQRSKSCERSPPRTGGGGRGGSVDGARSILVGHTGRVVASWSPGALRVIGDAEPASAFTDRPRRPGRRTPRRKRPRRPRPPPPRRRRRKPRRRPRPRPPPRSRRRPKNLLQWAIERLGADRRWACSSSRSTSPRWSSSSSLSFGLSEAVPVGPRREARSGDQGQEVPGGVRRLQGERLGPRPARADRRRQPAQRTRRGQGGDEQRCRRKLVTHMEARISYLAIIGSLGPMIGLVGTIAGMIASFQEIATAAGCPAEAREGGRGDQRRPSSSRSKGCRSPSRRSSSSPSSATGSPRSRIESYKVADRTITALLLAAKQAKTARSKLVRREGRGNTPRAPKRGLPPPMSASMPATR